MSSRTSAIHRLVVSNQAVTYNALQLTKTILMPAGAAAAAGTDWPPVTIGDEVTYSINFDQDDQPLTHVSVIDALPVEIAFVRATGDGVYGHYDVRTHSYTWLNPPRSAGRTTCLELSGRVEPNTPAGQTFTNSATLTAYQRPPTTATDGDGGHCGPADLPAAPFGQDRDGWPRRQRPPRRRRRRAHLSHRV
jgi:uncharacterized repeat protein (TIGR01451 family)